MIIVLLQVVIEIPYATIQVLFYALIVYGMLGYEWMASKFLMYFFFMWISVLNFIYYGMMVLAVSPNQETAAILTGFLYNIWTLFAGFVIPRKVPTCLSISLCHNLRLPKFVKYVVGINSWD